MNVLYHFLVCLLLFRLLEVLGTDQKQNMFLTIVFAVHPILIMAVCWIGGRNDILLSVFSLAGMINFIRFVKERRNKYCIYHLVFLALALFTKESGIVLIFLCLLYFVLFIPERFLIKKLIWCILFYSIIVAVWYLLRKVALQSFSDEETTLGRIIEYLPEVPFIILFYFQKFLLPFNLTGLTPTIAKWPYVCFILSFLLLFVLFYYFRWVGRKKNIFGLLWFFGFIAPTLVAPTFEGGIGMMEHRTYLPMMGFLLALGETEFVRSISDGKRNEKKLFKIFLVPALFSVITFFQVSRYKNEIVF